MTALTYAPALKKRMRAKKVAPVVLTASEGLPEYAEDVNSRRLAAMQAHRAKRFRQAFPTQAAREQYGAERLAYIHSFGK